MTDRHPTTSLERARYAKGYSREHVARVLGISAKTVERQESGERHPKRKRIEEYAKIYDVDASTFEDMLAPPRGGAQVAEEAV